MADKKPMSHTRAIATIVGGVFLAPLMPIVLAADVVRNAVRKAKDDREDILGECDIADSVERKLFGDM